MAVTHPRIHWGARDVEWTYVPETTDEITSVARRMFAEALGTLGFVFLAGAALIVNGTVTDGGLGLLGMAAATGVAYALMVYMFHPISGGHINPAITLGEMCARRMPPSIAGLYIVAQAGGAVLGALLLEVIFRDFVGDASGAATLSFADEMTGWTGALFEGILAFALVVAYFRAFVHGKGDPTVGAVTLGLIVGAAFLVAFPLTGAALNASRVFGTALVANEWTDFGWYALGALGGAVAGLVYDYVFQTPEEVATGDSPGREAPASQHAA
jgi:glycerol uptake facilitator-like aquaporin